VNLPIQAKIFDGKSAKAQFVELRIESNFMLKVENIENRKTTFYKRQELKLNAPFDSGVWTIALPGGESIEFEAESSVRDFFKKDGFLHLSVLSLEKSPPKLIALAVLACCFLIVIYFYVLPAAVELSKPLVPEKVKLLIGNQIVDILENKLGEESQIPESTKAKIRESFHRITKSLELHEAYELRFVRLFPSEERKEGLPNALAVLPNTIFVTDSLVSLLNQDELEAVIAHELGHLFYDHGTSMLLRSSFITISTMLLVGPDPSFVHALALALIDASFSQAQELQADAKGVQILKTLGQNPDSLASALEKLSQQLGESSELASYISTHPRTDERIEQIRAAGIH
jgi:Zn-dependent protease with chaperone function